MAIRQRRWGAVIAGVGLPVLLRNYAILDPGEDLTEEPPTKTIPWSEWLTDHATVYDLTLDGRSRAELLPMRDAYLRIKAKGDTDPDWAAVALLFRGILRELDTPNPP
jgi:hypothetical protein